MATESNTKHPLLLEIEEGSLEKAKLMLEQEPALLNQSLCCPLSDGSVGTVTPLHSAISLGNSEFVKHLVSLGADVHVLTSPGGLTTICRAAFYGNADIIRYLVDQGVDVTKASFPGYNPLHCAAQEGHYKAVVLLVEEFHLDLSVTTKDGQTALYCAARRGQKDIVEYLVSKGADIFTQTNDGLQPIHTVARGGYIELMEFLISHGADPSVTTSKGWTPLHYAGRFGHLDIVQFLVETFKVDIQCKTSYGNTPLLLSAFSSLKILKYLLSKGGNLKDTAADGEVALHYAAQQGQLDIVKYLLSLGVDINVVDLGDITAFHYAALTNNVEVGRYLASCDAKLETCATDGRTPLIGAAEKGNIEFFQMCINELKMDVNSNAPTSAISETSLIAAVRGGQLETVKLLASLGVDVNQKDHGGESLVFHAACSGQDKPMFELLLSLGAELQTPANSGKTPLNDAADHGHNHTIQALIDLGADVNVKDGEESPVYSAAQSGNSEAIKLLHSKGADINISLASGASPLFIASQEGHTEAVKTLLALKADIEKARHDGQTPLFIAAAFNRLDILRLLIDAGADVESRSFGWQTPLASAASFFSVDTFECLLDHGADPLLPFQNASESNKVVNTPATLPFSEQIEINEDPSLEPSKSGLPAPSIESVPIPPIPPLLPTIEKTNEKVNNEDLIECATWIVYCLCEIGAIEKLRYVLAPASPLLSHFDPNRLYQKTNETAIHPALRSSSTEAISLLTSLGCSPYYADSLRTTRHNDTNLNSLPNPYRYVWQNYGLMLSQTVREGGWNAFVRTEKVLRFNRRPLHIALHLGAIETVKGLIRPAILTRDKRSPLLLSDSLGWTPLHDLFDGSIRPRKKEGGKLNIPDQVIPINSDHLACLKLLIEDYPAVDILACLLSYTNEGGLTPLDCLPHAPGKQRLAKTILRLRLFFAPKTKKFALRKEIQAMKATRTKQQESYEVGQQMLEMLYDEGYVRPSLTSVLSFRQSQRNKYYSRLHAYKERATDRREAQKLAFGTKPVNHWIAFPALLLISIISGFILPFVLFASFLLGANISSAFIQVPITTDTKTLVGGTVVTILLLLGLFFPIFSLVPMELYGSLFVSLFLLILGIFLLYVTWKSLFIPRFSASLYPSTVVDWFNWKNYIALGLMLKEFFDLIALPFLPSLVSVSWSNCDFQTGDNCHPLLDLPIYLRIILLRQLPDFNLQLPSFIGSYWLVFGAWFVWMIVTGLLALFSFLRLPRGHSLRLNLFPFVTQDWFTRFGVFETLVNVVGEGALVPVVSVCLSFLDCTSNLSLDICEEGEESACDIVCWKEGHQWYAVGAMFCLFSYLVSSTYITLDFKESRERNTSKPKPSKDIKFIVRWLLVKTTLKIGIVAAGTMLTQLPYFVIGLTLIGTGVLALYTFLQSPCKDIWWVNVLQTSLFVGTAWSAFIAGLSYTYFDDKGKDSWLGYALYIGLVVILVLVFSITCCYAKDTNSSSNNQTDTEVGGYKKVSQGTWVPVRT